MLDQMDPLNQIKIEEARAKLQWTQMENRKETVKAMWEMIQSFWWGWQWIAWAVSGLEWTEWWQCGEFVNNVLRWATGNKWWFGDSL